MNDIVIDEKKWRLYESCFIKSIRRGYTDDAVYWGLVCYRVGKKMNVWRRMLIHVSEDIGPANFSLPVVINALHQNWIYLLGGPGGDYKAAYETDNTELLPLVHAIILMAESRKSREVDNAVCVHCHAPFAEREPPDYATDLHSPKGRRMGRDIEHWITEASKINNASGLDQWEEKANEFMRNK